MDFKDLNSLVNFRIDTLPDLVKKVFKNPLSKDNPVEFYDRLSKRLDKQKERLILESKINRDIRIEGLVDSLCKGESFDEDVLQAVMNEAFFSLLMLEASLIEKNKKNIENPDLPF